MEAPALVVLDDLDARPDGERWLRERVLPGLPAGTVVAVAARRPPSIGWTTDPGWRNLLRVLRLGELGTAGADELVRRAEVPERHLPAIRAAAGEHPLALRLACELTLAGVDDRAVRLAVARTVLRHVVGDLPSPEHRHLLERSAYTPAIVVPPGAPGLDVFHWLCARPYVDCDPAGVHLIPGVRSAVRRELRWRDPVRHRQLTREADTVRAMTGMQRADFDRHLRAALRTWRQPDRLARNPLAGARIVAEHELAEPGTALQAVLRAAVDALGGDARGDRVQRVVAATYLKGVPTQEAAAERLGLPSSTYRRHLVQGVDMLGDLLWRQEHPDRL